MPSNLEIFWQEQDTPSAAAISDTSASVGHLDCCRDAAKMWRGEQ